MKKALSALFLILTLLVAIILPSTITSDEMDVNIIIAPVIPAIESPTLTDLDDNIVTDLDVGREYKVNFEILEKNGIEDIVSVNVKLYYAGDGSLGPSEHDKRCSYEITWENVGNGSWQSYPSGYLGTNTHFRMFSPCLFEFSFPFILDKVAIPTGSENTWMVEITVIDEHGYYDIDQDIHFDVNDYIEWNGIPSQIDLSPENGEPESPWTLSSSINIQTSITSNTEVDVYFQSNPVTKNGLMIDPVEYFTIRAMNDPTGGSIANGYEVDKAVPSDNTRIYQGVYSTPCGLNPSVDGYVDHDGGLVSFRIDVQDDKSVPHLQGGTYLSSWVFSIERGQGTTL